MHRPANQDDDNASIGSENESIHRESSMPEQHNILKAVPNRGNDLESLVPDRVNVFEPLPKDRKLQPKQGDKPESSSKTVLASVQATPKLSVPRGNAFLPTLGQNQHWNKMLQRVYHFARSHGSLDLKLIQDKDPELGAWVAQQKGRLSENCFVCYSSLCTSS